MSLLPWAWCLGSGLGGGSPEGPRNGQLKLTLRECHIQKQLGQHRMTFVLEPFQRCLGLRGPSSRDSCSLVFARAVRACLYFCLDLPRRDLGCRRLGGWLLASASRISQECCVPAMVHHYRAEPTWIMTLLLHSRHRRCGGTVEAEGFGGGFGSSGRGRSPQRLSNGVSGG